MSTPTLATALDHLRLDGAIFLRGEYTEAWAYESPTGEMMASLLRPGRERLLFFHIIANGRCWVRDRRRRAALGRARRRRRAAVRAPAPDGRRDRRRRASRSWTCSHRRRGRSCPVIRHGAGGERTDVICGYLDVDDPLFDPALARAAADLRRPSDRRGRSRGSSRASRYVLEATEGGDDRLADPRRACRRSCSPRCCASTSPRRRPPTTAGSPRCAIRCSRRRSPSCTGRPSGSGPSPTSPRRRTCPARCSTSGSATCSADHRSATSPTGASTSPRTSSPPPTSASHAVARRVGYDVRGGVQPRLQARLRPRPAHWRARPGFG